MTCPFFRLCGPLIIRIVGIKIFWGLIRATLSLSQADGGRALNLLPGQGTGTAWSEHDERLGVCIGRPTRAGALRHLGHEPPMRPNAPQGLWGRTISFCIGEVRRMYPEDDLGRSRVESTGLAIHAVQIRTRWQSLEPETDRMESPWLRRTSGCSRAGPGNYHRVYARGAPACRARGSRRRPRPRQEKAPAGPRNPTGNGAGGQPSRFSRNLRWQPPQPFFPRSPNAAPIRSESPEARAV